LRAPSVSHAGEPEDADSPSFCAASRYPANHLPGALYRLRAGLTGRGEVTQAQHVRHPRAILHIRLRDRRDRRHAITTPPKEHLFEQADHAATARDALEASYVAMASGHGTGIGRPAPVE